MDETEETQASIDPYLVVKLPKKPLFLIVVILIVLGAAEGIYGFIRARRLKRRAERRKQQEFENGTYAMVLKTTRGDSLLEEKGDVVFVTDPFVLYRLEKNQKTSELTTNSLGFRGKNWPPAKRTGDHKRILILGSSAVFGFRVKDDKAFPIVLEGKLKEKYPGASFEILNAGVLGYLSHQDLALFSTELIKFNPDLVVIYNGWNDFHFGGLIGAEESVKSWMFNELEIVLERRKNSSTSLLQYSSLYQSLERKWLQAKKYKKVEEKGSFFKVNKQARLDYLHHVEIMIRLAKSYGIKILVSPQPEVTMREEFSPQKEVESTKPTVANGYFEYAKMEYPKYREGVRLLAKRERIQFFDTQPFLKQKSEDILFLDAVHLNDLGNELCAEALVPVIARTLGL